MWGVVVSMVGPAVELARQEHDAFMRSLDGLPEAERQRRIERREDQMAAERRHQEILEAAEDSKSSSGWSVGAMVLGSAIFGSGN